MVKPVMIAVGSWQK